MADPLGVVTPTPNPASRAAKFRARGFDAAHERFLEGEAAALARLRGFYEQAQAELRAFLRSGGATKSDREFYRALLAQVGATAAQLEAGTREYLAGTLPVAYVEGARLSGGRDFLFRPVHDRALRELSGYTLGLIRDTNEGIRRSVQQAVAAAITSGLTREELTDRILASGLQPGPWKDAATRAAVIARTETMRSYNAGNVAAIRETGAVAVEWHTARDERVCPKCGPLDGDYFVLPDVSDEEALAAGVPDTWSSLRAVGTAGDVLKVPPRHPRCRCTVRARYRDDAGNLLGEGPPPDDAATLAEAQAVGQGPIPTMADKAALADITAAGYDLDAGAALWRAVDADVLAEWLESGVHPSLTGAPAHQRRAVDWTYDQFGNLLALRYDLRFGVARAMRGDVTPLHYGGIIRGIEKYAEALGKPWRSEPAFEGIFVMESLGEHPFGGYPGAQVPGEYNPRDGTIAISRLGLEKLGYEMPERPGMTAWQSMIEHELGHATEARLFGPHRGAPFASTFREYLELDASEPRTVIADLADIVRDGAAEAWHRIHDDYVGAANERQARIELAEAQGGLRASRERLERTDISESSRATHEALVERFGRSVEQLEGMLKGATNAEPWPTSYSANSQAEDFAESMWYYLNDPDYLRRHHPRRYEWMRTYVGEHRDPERSHMIAP